MVECEVRMLPERSEPEEGSAWTAHVIDGAGAAARIGPSVPLRCFCTLPVWTRPEGRVRAVRTPRTRSAGRALVRVRRLYPRNIATRRVSRDAAWVCVAVRLEEEVDHVDPPERRGSHALVHHGLPTVWRHCP